MFINTFSDKKFLKSLMLLAIPLIMQNFFEASIHILNTSMIGALGDSKIAAAGIGNQIVFIYLVVIFGLNSGASVFIAQFYGAKDYENIRKMVWLNLSLGILTSIIFTLLCIFIPEELFRIFTKDREVIGVGSSYLKLISYSFLPTGIAFSILFSLRSIGIVKSPTLVSIFSMVLSIVLSYLFIFGIAGLPQMGVNGAALGLVIAKFIEGVVLVLVIKKYKEIIPALNEYKKIGARLLNNVTSKTVPVMLNEIAWVLAITAFLAIYSRMGTDYSAAANIFITIEKLGIILFWGLAQACAVLVGNAIGEGDYQKGYAYSNTTLNLGVMSAIVVGIIMFFLKVPIVEFFNASDTVNAYTLKILSVFIILLPIKAYTAINLVGVLRSGGDAGYAFKIEAISQWLVAIPLCAICAFYFKMDIMYVYIAQCSEEVIKICFCYLRFRSKRWINNLVEAA